MWCGDVSCENKVKEITGAHSRCIPFSQEKLSDKCAICGKTADKMIVWRTTILKIGECIYGNERFGLYRRFRRKLFGV